jgi:probable HAF family extracellular repeat protein
VRKHVARGLAGLGVAAAVIWLTAGGSSSAAPAGRWVVRDTGVSMSLYSEYGELKVSPDYLAVNERGQVVGWENGGTRGRAFLWDQGRLTSIAPFHGDTWSRAIAVNDRGQIVGVSYKDSSDGRVFPHAFLWANGRMQRLGVSGVVRRGDLSEPIGINQRGEVAGTVSASNPDTDYPYRAVVWRPRVHSLGNLPGGQGSSATAINDRGQIVGTGGTGDRTQSAFLWANGKMRSLGVLPGETDSRAVDINDHGQVLGKSTHAGRGGRSFVWQNGKMHVIPLGAKWTPLAINNRGQVAFALGRRQKNWWTTWAIWQAGQTARWATSGAPMALNDRGQIALVKWGSTPSASLPGSGPVALDARPAHSAWAAA